MLLEVGEDVQREPLVLQLEGHELAHVGHDLVDVEERGHDLELAAQDGAVVDEVVDEGEQQKGVDADVAVEEGVGGPLVGGVEAFGLGVEEDGVEGGAEVVGDAVDHLLAEVAHLLDAEVVVQLFALVY